MLLGRRQVVPRLVISRRRLVVRHDEDVEALFAGCRQHCSHVVEESYLLRDLPDLGPQFSALRQEVVVRIYDQQSGVFGEVCHFLGVHRTSVLPLADFRRSGKPSSRRTRRPSTMGPRRACGKRRQPSAASGDRGLAPTHTETWPLEGPPRSTVSKQHALTLPMRVHLGRYGLLSRALRSERRPATALRPGCGSASATAVRLRRAGRHDRPDARARGGARLPVVPPCRSAAVTLLCGAPPGRHRSKEGTSQPGSALTPRK